MPTVRMIYVTFPSDQAELAERNWKEKCAPLMIKQPGCLSEELLRCKEHPGEYISYSSWDSEESVRKYLESEDHQEIKRHNRNIKGAQVLVKNYELVG
ncbi:MAG: antibiotic biosynthesis monooxygenase [Acetobacteraceae bacterium]|nr:antibiotic biosynthesis monooxygenase [Acetobacteraceae bacterium]MBV8592452.1 antibiotic biosynthesis monooxygenase [Acetobacteraceae bacterium]